MLNGTEIAFIIVCCIFILFVIMQNTLNNSMGGLAGGSSTTTSKITGLTKVSGFFAFLFFALVFSLNLSHKHEPIVQESKKEITIQVKDIPSWNQEEINEDNK